MRKPPRQFIIPENLDLPLLLKGQKLPKEFSIDLAHLFLHQVINVPCFNDKFLTEDGYTLLNHEKLREIGIRRPKPIKDVLIRFKIIECDNQYIRRDNTDGEKPKSYGYRLCEEYQQKVRPVDCMTESLNRKYHAEKSFQRFQLRSYEHLIKWLEQVEVDDGEAEFDLYYKMILDGDEGSFSSKKKSRDGRSISDFESNADQKYAASRAALHRIAAKDLFYTVDKKGRRFHSNFTSMPSILRKYLRHNGKRLVSIDIVNSQPFFSLALFSPEFWGVQKITKKNFRRVAAQPFSHINNQLNQQITNSNNTQTHNTKQLSIMSDKLSHLIDSEEFSLFSKLILDGVFYEYLENVIKNSEDPAISIMANFSSRRQLKEMVFTVLFSDNRFINKPDSKSKDLFKKLFPLVYDFFRFIKRTNKANLALALQNIESYCIIERITRRIAKERPDLFILTIHDCLVTTDGNEEYVRKVMLEEIQKQVGHLPKLKIEPWFEEGEGIEMSIEELNAVKILTSQSA